MKEHLRSSLGPIKNLDHLDAIIEACAVLERDIRPLNRDNVRKESGVSANNLIAAGMALYKKRRELRDQAPHTPGVLIELICQVVNREFEHQEARLNEGLQKETMAFSEALAESSQAYEALQESLLAKQEECATLKTALFNKEATVTSLTEQHEIEAEKAESYEHKYRELLVRIESLNDRIQALDHEKEAEQQRHLKQEEKMAQKYADHKNDLMQSHQNMVERLQLNADKSTTEFKKRLAELTSKNRALEAKLVHVQQQSDETARAKQAIEIQLQELQTIKRLDDDKYAQLLEGLREAHERDMAEVLKMGKAYAKQTDENDHLKLQNEELSSIKAMLLELTEKK